MSPRFPPEDDTLPGVGRLRAALAQSDRPPPTRRQRRVRHAMRAGNGLLLAVGVGAIARAAAHKWWPAGAELIDAALTGVGF